MLDVDDRSDASPLLSFGHDVQTERGLTRRLGAEHFYDAAAGNATYA